MGYFLRRISLFAVFALMSYLVLLVVAGMCSPKILVPNLYNIRNRVSFLRERIHELPLHRNTDVLVLGSSVGQRGIDPRVALAGGITLFNLSSGAQQPQQTFTLLRRYLDTLQPRLVVLTAFPDVFERTFTEPALDLLLSDRLDYMSFEDAVRQNQPMIWNSLVYEWLRRTGHLRHYPLQTENDIDRYVAGGFLERKRPEFHTRKPLPCKPLQVWPPDPQPLRYLDSCIAFLKAKGVPYVLVQVPVAGRYYRCDPQVPRYDSLFAAKGPYLDMNGKLPLDDSLHFLDDTHLNPEGARLVTAALTDTLRRRLAALHK